MVIRVANFVCAENATKKIECLSKFAMSFGDRIIGVGKIIELYNRVEEIAAEMGF